MSILDLILVAKESLPVYFVTKDNISLNDINTAAFISAVKPKEFSISNLFTLYSLLSEGVIDSDSNLDDGLMYRNGKVYISGNAIKNEYEGFPHEKIEESLKSLCDFLNNDDSDIYALYNSVSYFLLILEVYVKS